jgi:exodeoxyribonuclease III
MRCCSWKAACFERLLSQGWTDALRRTYGDERVYTFWDYVRQHRQTDSGLRIDHLLVSPEIATHAKTAGVSKRLRGQPHVNDHAPTEVESRPLKCTRRMRKSGAA